MGERRNRGRNGKEGEEGIEIEGGSVRGRVLGKLWGRGIGLS